MNHRNPSDAGEAAAREHALYPLHFRALTWLCVPLWLGALAWCLHIAAPLPFGPLELPGRLLGAGVIGGTLAIHVAHGLTTRRCSYRHPSRRRGGRRVMDPRAGVRIADAGQNRRLTLATSAGPGGRIAQRRCSLDSRRSSSRYSQTRVTIRPKAPYHSMLRGAP